MNWRTLPIFSIKMKTRYSNLVQYHDEKVIHHAYELYLPLSEADRDHPALT